VWGGERKAWCLYLTRVVEVALEEEGGWGVAHLLVQPVCIERQASPRVQKHLCQQPGERRLDVELHAAHADVSVRLA
jgi:hypothetical protein